LSMPGEVIGKGPVAMVRILALPITFLVVGYFLVPVYMRQRVTSAYQLLEERLDLSVRLLGVAMFLCLRLVWMSLLVYLASKALIVMMGVDETYIPWIVLATGLVSVIYTSLGGLRAVVVTDLIQTILLFGGALLVLGVVTWDFGGFGWFPTEWQANWDPQPVFSFDPKVRVTAFGTVLGVVCWYVSTAGGDQVSIQRFMATRDADAARRAYGTQMVVSAVVVVVLFLVGLALLGYFRAHPEWLPEGTNLRKDADDLFPLFISYHLPPGISGLVVAAMFAAAMSSLDSGVNSITAVVMTDLLERFGLRPKTEKAYVLAARLLAFGIGATIVVGSMFVKNIPGNFMAVTEKAVNLLVTPIFSLFFFALFVPFARPLGVWAGWFCGTTTAILIAFSGPIFGYNPVTGYDPVSFQWIAPSALTVNITVGLIVSRILSKKS
ncbi:MAG: sodium-coupled permease, partial [Candidatus Omnitrophica bacterium]|nr:sodium-coupled permease [Candidatus Omnitrophota bacterium]